MIRRFLVEHATWPIIRVYWDWRIGRAFDALD